MTTRTAPKSSRKVVMEIEQMKISRPSSFMSAPLLKAFKFNTANILGEQPVSVLAHVDSESGGETKAVLIELLKRVPLKNVVLHFIDQTKLGTSSSAHM